MKFLHRNGETEPPTEAGWYWFYSDDDAEVYAEGVFTVESDNSPLYIPIDGDLIFVDQVQGRWWGPVTPPWEGL